MSTPPPEPAWDKLPHDPQGFFELADDFDRKDLKRSYNRLLRRYKPEKFPAEFQQIRDAYETLDNQLRYGAQPQRHNVTFEEYTWSMPSDINEQHQTAEPQRKLKAKVESYHRRLATEPAGKLYAEISQLNEKQPYHYYALAVLSDGLEEHDPQKFLKWILTGLKATPHDPALFQLLSAYVRHSVTEKQLASVLKAVSKVITDDRFYFLTEPLWDRLLKQFEFALFRKTLERCEAQISDYQLVRKLTFYIHILKAAAWSGDADWVLDAYRFIEDHYQEIPPFLEYDVELLLHLQEYLGYREEFLAGKPIRHLIDSTLRKCCTLDSLEAERAFLKCQVNLSGRGRELLEAFPPLDESPAIFAFMPLWQLVSIEYIDRLEQSQTESEPSALRIRPALLEIEAKTNRTGLGHLWNFSSYVYAFGSILIYPLLFVICMLLSATLFGKQSDPFMRFVVSLVIAAIGGWSLKKYVGNRLWSGICVRMAEKCYRTIWRTELQLIMSRTFIPYYELIERIRAAGDPDNQLTCQSWMMLFCAHDPGLELYSRAQQYVI